jgi:hypothetical protein
MYSEKFMGRDTLLDQVQVVEFITLNTRINREIVRLIQNRDQIMSPVDRLIKILSP